MPAERQFHKQLLHWYAVNKRTMPWRGNPDPYAVWVSEIMLQQTQVATVHDYFIRFMTRFPTVASLATAPEQDVLKLWEGLGYYTRARNLQRAAQIVVQNGNVLPRTCHAWATLPGVGFYTASAIASICFGEYTPVVDGNVIRVFSRYRGMEDDFSKMPPRAALAQWLTPHITVSRAPADFNQAMMELGALVCTPKAPHCAQCPLRRQCVAYAAGTQETFPRKRTKKAIPVRRETGILVCNSAGGVLLTRRTQQKLLQGLWELPSLPIPPRAKCLGVVTHTFSHFKLELTVYRATPRMIHVTESATLQFAKPATLPLTTATRKALVLAEVIL